MTDNTAPESVSDKIQRVDHDTLIRLEGKVDTISSTVQNIKDDFSPKFVELNTRVTEQRKDIDTLLLWKHDFSLGWRFTTIIISVLGSIIGFVVAQVAKVYLKW